VPSEREKMLAGELYDPHDAELAAARPARNRARALLHRRRHRLAAAAVLLRLRREIILPGVRIGPRAVVGAGSVVTRDVPPDVFAGAIPAAWCGS
jgi:hypothetical protein